MVCRRTLFGDLPKDMRVYIKNMLLEYPYVSSFRSNRYITENIEDISRYTERAKQLVGNRKLSGIEVLDRITCVPDKSTTRAPCTGHKGLKFEFADGTYLEFECPNSVVIIFIMDYFIEISGDYKLKQKCHHQWDYDHLRKYITIEGYTKVNIISIASPANICIPYTFRDKNTHCNDCNAVICSMHIGWWFCDMCGEWLCVSCYRESHSKHNT